MEYKDIEKVNSQIKLTPIKGKDYAEVPERVTAFRKLFPEGTIETEIESCQNGVCVIKATISNEGKVLATGHAYEKEGSTFINKTSYIENCETSAIGRALGFIGIIGGGSIASYEEVANAKLNQDNAPSRPAKAAGAPSGAPSKNDLVKKIKTLAKAKNITDKEICEQGGVDKIENLVESQMVACIQWLERM